MNRILVVALTIFLTCQGGLADGCWGQSDDPVDSLWSRTGGQDWPTFLGPQGDGYSRESGLLSDWSGDRLQVRWSLETGEGYGMGTVAQGRFFHFGRYGKQAVLKCVNAESGKLLWEYGYASEYDDMYGYDKGPRASPVVDGDRVYVYGVEGQLHCIDVKTGKRRWMIDTMSEFNVVQNFFGVGSTPVIHEDLLLVMVGGSPEESLKLPPGRLASVKSNGTGVVAFDKQSGEIKYRCLDDLASYATIKIAQLGGQPVALAWMRGGLHAWEPATGRNLATAFPFRARMLESVNAATPVVIGDKIFLSECYQHGSVLLDWNGGDWQVVWTDQGKRGKAMETHWNTPIVIGEHLYGSSGRNSGDAELRCIHWPSGEIKWKQGGLSRASITRLGDQLVVLGEHGDLLLLRPNPTRFEEITRYDAQAEGHVKLRSPCWAAPIVSHGLMWVRGKNRLVCFELRPEQE